MFIIVWDFLMFYQIFLSSQAKRRAIISNKHGTYKLPQELPKNLKKLGISGKSQVLSPLLEMKSFLVLVTISWKLEFDSNILWIIAYALLAKFLSNHGKDRFCLNCFCNFEKDEKLMSFTCFIKVIIIVRRQC